MSHHILLVGGHGKIAQLLTPLLLAKSWNVTSMIRTASQIPAIEALGTHHPGQLSILVHSLAAITSEAAAQAILDHVKPDWVVWSAGAGGKGGAEATLAIDRDAAIYFTQASVRTASVKKFVTVSYLASRRGQPSWWSEADCEAAARLNREVLPTYYQAKVAADEVLTVLAERRWEEEGRKGVVGKERFCGVSFRPGVLTDGGVGRVGVGGTTGRSVVAEGVVAVLEMEGARGWIDVVDGGEGGLRG